MASRATQLVVKPQPTVPVLSCLFPLVLAGPPLPSKARLYLQAQPPTPPPRLAFCQSECQGTFINESPGPNPVPGTWTVTEGGGGY